MKILLSIPVLAAFLFVTSCRTALPVDPNTLKPSTRCLPGNMTASESELHGTK